MGINQKGKKTYRTTHGIKEFSGIDYRREKEKQF
jgi:hypothetical protein